MTAKRKAGARAGAFIVLEGLDGAGTTTQTGRLASALRAQGYTVVTTREPSDGPIGTQIRQALTGRLSLPGNAGALTDETMALLFAADRLDHLAADVQPAVDRGEIVLCDRYVLSSLAYQGATLPMSWVAEINGRARPADLTLFLEVDVAVAGKRRAVRGGREELYESDDRQRKTHRQYQAACSLWGKRERLVRVDGALTPDQVTSHCLAAIEPLLGGEARKKR